MAEQTEEWEYCQIKFQLRYKGEDISRSGLKQVWLVFLAHAIGPYKNYLAGETEIPVAGNVAGAPFMPQKNNISHVNIHQNLLRELQDDGWKLLPKEGGVWWENRLRRPAVKQKNLAGWLRTISHRIWGK